MSKPTKQQIEEWETEAGIFADDSSRSSGSDWFQVWPEKFAERMTELIYAAGRRAGMEEAAHGAEEQEFKHMSWTGQGAEIAAAIRASMEASNAV